MYYRMLSTLHSLQLNDVLIICVGCVILQVSLFPALGGFLFSVTLTGKLYEANKDEGESSCYGQK